MCSTRRLINDAKQTEQILPKGESLVAFKPVVTRLIEDVQERLIFVAQTYMRDKITDYVPKPADLNYPDKLIEGMLVRLGWICFNFLSCSSEKRSRGSRRSYKCCRWYC